jgi:hypothetical protein
LDNRELKKINFSAIRATSTLSVIAILPLASRRTGMGFRVTLDQPRPNANAVRFVLDRVIAEQPASFLQADAAKHCPLAEQLFLIAGVRSILFLADFVTINKHSDVPWPSIKRQVKQLLAKATEFNLSNNA